MVRRSKTTTIVYYTILTVAALIVILPFLWLLFTSFDKTNSYSLPFPPRLFPKNPSLFNYKMALVNVPMLQYLFNTILLVIISLVLSMFISTLSGFCLSKGKFPGKNILLLFIMSNMMIPFESKLMPTYGIIKMLGLSNSFMGVLLPGIMTNAMFIFFVKQFVDDLPDSLYEASVIDGAGKIRIYWQIFLPLMQSIIATLAVLNVIAVWNDLLWPMIVLTDSKLYTVQLGLIRYNNSETGIVHAGISTALSIMSIIPLSIVFSFLQKYIVQSVAATGIKQ